MLFSTAAAQNSSVMREILCPDLQQRFHVICVFHPVDKSGASNGGGFAMDAKLVG